MHPISAIIQPLIDLLTSATPPARYDREAAIAYARQNWNKICDDDCIGLDASNHVRGDTNKPLLPAFIKVPGASKNFYFKPTNYSNPNPREPGVKFGEAIITTSGYIASAPISGETVELVFFYLGDCTHFMSHILVHGGIPVPNQGTDIVGICGPGALADFLMPSDPSKQAYAKIVGNAAGYSHYPDTIGETTNLDAHAAEIDAHRKRIMEEVTKAGFGKGDLVGYKKNKGFFHLALYPGEENFLNHKTRSPHNIICHTYCRVDDDSVAYRPDDFPHTIWSVNALKETRIFFIKML